MHTGPDPMEEYAAAMAAERNAWEAVRARLPGSPDFNHELWRRWRVAVSAADEAAARAKRAVVSEPVKQKGRRFLGKSWPAAIQLPPILSRLRLPGPPG